MNNQILLKKARFHALFQRFKKPVNIKQMDQQTLLQANILGHSILKNVQQLNLNSLLMPNHSELLLSKLIKENKSVQRMIRRPSQLDLKTPIKQIQSQISGLKKHIRQNQASLQALQSGKTEAALQAELSHVSSAFRYQSRKNKYLSEQLKRIQSPDAGRIDKQIDLLKSDIDRLDFQIARTRRLLQRQSKFLQSLDSRKIRKPRQSSLINRYTFVKSEFHDVQ